MSQKEDESLKVAKEYNAKIQAILKNTKGTIDAIQSKPSTKPTTTRYRKERR